MAPRRRLKTRVEKGPALKGDSFFGWSASKAVGPFESSQLASQIIMKAIARGKKGRAKAKNRAAATPNVRKNPKNINKNKQK